MFPPPRQQHVDAMVTPDEEIKKLPHETLIIHGRDDKVIPLETSLKLLHLIDNCELHVFSRCGHWTQIERADEFSGLLSEFIGRDSSG